MKKLILFWILMIMLSAFVSAGFFDDFESYNAGEPLGLESPFIWTCSEGFDSDDCEIQDNTILSGEQLLKLYGGRYDLQDAKTLFNQNVNTGIVRVWIQLGGSRGYGGISGSNDQSVVIFDSTAWNSDYPADNSVNNDSVHSALNIEYRNTGAGCFIDEWNVWNSDTMDWDNYVVDIGVGESVLPTVDSCVINGTFLITMNFDIDEVSYAVYSKDKSILLSVHNETYDINPVGAIHKLILQGRTVAQFSGDSSTMYFDNVQYDFGNSKPIVSNVDISPQINDGSFSSTCSYDFFDADNDVDSSTLKWKINGVEITFYENSSILPQGVASNGDTVLCEVTAYDGIENGNIASDSVVIGGVIISEEETVLSSELLDSESIAFSILAMDYHESDYGISSIISYVGINGATSYLGVTDLYTLDSFGNSYIKTTGDQFYYSVSNWDSTIWTSSNDFVQRFSGLTSGLSLQSATLDNYSLADFEFLDIQALSDDTALSCYLYTPTGSEGITAFEYNYSSFDLDNVGVLALDGCRDIKVDSDNDLAFVDLGLNGFAILNISNLTSMNVIDIVAPRDAYFWFNRQDTLAFKDGHLWIDNEGSGLIYENMETNATSVVSGSCVDNGVYNSVDLLADDFLVFSKVGDNDLYACDYANSVTQQIYSNPNNIIGKDLLSFSSGVNNYLYTYDEDGIIVLSFSTVEESVNQLPEFIDSTADSQFVDNLNPIATNVSPVGLETAVVNIYPLSCLNSNFYDCSEDAEGDTILFAVDKDSDGDLEIDWTSVENEFVTYDVAGLYTMRIYITDDVHPNIYSVFKDIVINVSGEPTPLPNGSGTLKFRVTDTNSGLFLLGVQVSVEGEGNFYTDINGLVVAVVPEGVYLVEFSKNSYVSKTNYFSTSSITQEVNIVPVAVGDIRTLVLTVQDDDSNLLPDIFVEIESLFTHNFDYGYTDATGKIVFNPIEENILIFVDSDDYEVFAVEVYVPLGVVTYRDIILSALGSTSSGSIGLTGCEDYIPNVLLCNYNQFSCDVDADCITDKCDATGKCSNFNWTLCDEQGISRGNRCFVKNTGGSLLKSLGDLIIDNFFIVLIIVFFLLALLVFSIRNR